MLDAQLVHGDRTVAHTMASEIHFKVLFCCRNHFSAFLKWGLIIKWQAHYAHLVLSLFFPVPRAERRLHPRNAGAVPGAVVMALVHSPSSR